MGEILDTWTILLLMCIGAIVSWIGPRIHSTLLGPLFRRKAELERFPVGTPERMGAKALGVVATAQRITIRAMGILMILFGGLLLWERFVG